MVTTDVPLRAASETFPFPAAWQTNAALEEAERVYYEFRADLMVLEQPGVTAT